MNNPYDISRFIQPYIPQQIAQPVVVPMPQPVMGSFMPTQTDTIGMVLMILGVLVVIFFIHKYICISTEPTEPVVVDTYIPMPDPLGDKGWEVIVTDTCPYCVKQKKILQEYFPTFKNIFNNKSANVVPTWRNTKTGEVVEGMLSYERLLSLK